MLLIDPTSKPSKKSKESALSYPGLTQLTPSKATHARAQSWWRKAGGSRLFRGWKSYCYVQNPEMWHCRAKNARGRKPPTGDAQESPLESSATSQCRIKWSLLLFVVVVFFWGGGTRVEERERITKILSFTKVRNFN